MYYYAIILHHIQCYNLIRVNEVIGHLRSCVFKISIPGITQVQLNCHYTLLSKRHLSGPKQTRKKLLQISYYFNNFKLEQIEFSCLIHTVFLCCSLRCYWLMPRILRTKIGKQKLDRRKTYTNTHTHTSYVILGTLYSCSLRIQWIIMLLKS